MQESCSSDKALTSKMYDHKEPWKNCPVLMLYNIAEPEKAYDKCHHLRTNLTNFF